MELVAVIVMILVLFSLIGVLAFLVYDYLKYKDETTLSLQSASKSITNEKSERLSNLKYMVDQVNTVNTDIFNTFNSNMALQTSNIDTMRSNQDKMVSGLNTFLTFSSNESIPIGSGQISLINLPGVVAPDVRLIKHVTAVSGFTIKDLGNSVGSSNTAIFCSKDDPNRCIRFPDADGNTFLTSLKSDGSVVMGSKSEFRNELNFSYVNSGTVTQYGTIKPTTTTNPDVIVDARNNLLLRAGKVGVSRNEMTPEAALNIVSTDATTNVFKAQSTVPNANPVVIKPDGTLVVRNLQIGDEADTQRITISKNNETNELIISAPYGINVSTTRTGAAPTTIFNHQVKLMDTTSELRGSMIQS
jgi:hypothetical protein